MDLSTSRFPQKLFDLLETASSDPYMCAIISWQPDGRAFAIRDETAFISIAQPQWFRLTKIRSFYRQLYLWEFEKVKKGPNQGAWFHERFQRDAPSSEMNKMKRVKIKGKVIKKEQKHIKRDIATAAPICVTSRRVSVSLGDLNKTACHDNYSQEVPNSAPSLDPMLSSDDTTLPQYASSNNTHIPMYLSKSRDNFDGYQDELLKMEPLPFMPSDSEGEQDLDEFALCIANTIRVL